jgi:hypothetical protein
VLHVETQWSVAGTACAHCSVHHRAGDSGAPRAQPGLVEHGRAPLDLWHYLATGHFVSATFENWESEFLQMGMYVLLTVSLRQRGSAESRPFDPAQEHSRVEPGPTPWPVRRGGVWKVLYGHSLAIAFGLLFLLSFTLHALGSWRPNKPNSSCRACPARLPRTPGQQHVLVRIHAELAE